jgi:hypothetical protein
MLFLIGLTGRTPWCGLHAPETPELPEVRLHAAVQAFELQVAVDLAREIEALYTNGPAGGGGVETSVRDAIAIISTLAPRELVEPRVEVVE